MIINFDIICWNVGICVQMMIKFGYQCLVKMYYFIFVFFFWIEIVVVFIIVYWQGSQGIFEGLFKVEEFENGKVN